LLGAGQIDPLAATPLHVLSLTEPSRRSSMRVVADSIASHQTAIFCVHGIEEGDALALATRFDCGYAYRGRQALFWNVRYAAREVLDRYLPNSPLRPFDRRGLLQVEGSLDGAGLALIATQFAAERAVRVPEVRFARSVLRATGRIALLFVTGAASGAMSFADLGFTTIASAAGTMVAARDVRTEAAVVTV
jgi:hypothetical protein